MNSENLFFNTIPSAFNKSLEIPTSKSYANRALIMAAISPREITLNDIPKSTDVEAMIQCLRSIGIEILEEGKTVRIINSFPACEVPANETVVIHTGDGGTTNRFLIPLLALGKNRYNLKATEKMLERPMDELEEVLVDLGVSVTRNEDTWFELCGPYKIKKFVIEVDCSRSTQFATGLALSLSALNVDIEPNNLNTSRPYWEMTLNIIENFKSDSIFDVPVDFSSLSYPLALATLTGEVLVKNCKGVDRFQADSSFIYALEKMGVVLKFTKEGLKLKKEENLVPIDMDCKNCPDLVPTLCFLASYVQGKSSLQNVSVLRHKECDRLFEMLKMLSAFGVSANYDEATDVLSIIGRLPHGEIVNYDPPVDHRMVMVAYMFQRINGGGKLSNVQSVSKSFPNFFKVMESLV